MKCQTDYQSHNKIQNIRMLKLHMYQPHILKKINKINKKNKIKVKI